MEELTEDVFFIAASPAMRKIRSQAALVAYVASESRGTKMNVALNHPKEREAFELGGKMFVFRGGTHDFSCLTCHGDDGKRIRLQDLPNLTTVEGAQKAYTTWPAYRVSQGEVRSFEWRLYDYDDDLFGGADYRANHALVGLRWEF